MKISNIALVAWKTFRHNSDKSSLYLELSTVFCLSLCVGIILGLNAIFSDLMQKSVAISQIQAPLVVPEIKDDKSIYNLHLGLSEKDRKTIEDFSVPGITLIKSERNVVVDENKDFFIVMPTDGAAICMTPKEIKSFTVYDISEGRNALGLPMNLASFNCSWQNSFIPIVQVPRKIWNRVYGDKIFSYKVDFTDLQKPYESIQRLNDLAQEHHFNVVNKSLLGLDYIKISILQKKIFDIVFSLLCILLMALMLMNCMIFIKNRQSDWKLFYLFKINRQQSNSIIIARFLFVFCLTIILSFSLGLLVANLSTGIITQYLLNSLKGIELGYKFEARDILFTYSLVFLIFFLSTIITIKGINKNKPLKSEKSENFKISNLNVSYHTLTQGKIDILKNVSLDLEAYKLTSIVGVSGSGKTTLLNSIFNNQYLDKEVEIDINKTVYVTQYPNLIEELTIEQNLNLFSQYDKDKLLSLSDSLGILKILSHYPAETSVGERQRACLVRALLNKPQNLILDEPTASLDNTNKVLIMDIIKKLLQNKELSYAVVVTHDPIVIEMCDTVYRLENNILSKV